MSDDAGVAESIAEYENEIRRLAQVTELRCETRGAFTAPQQAAVNSGTDLDVVILLEGLIDFGAERERLQKEIDKLTKKREGLARRLGSAGFLDKAPPAVIEETRGKLSDLDEQVSRFQSRLDRDRRLCSRARK